MRAAKRREEGVPARLRGRAGQFESAGEEAAGGGGTSRLRGRAGQFESAAETVPVTFLLSRMASHTGDRVPIPDVDAWSLLFEMWRVRIRAHRSRSRRRATTATKRPNPACSISPSTSATRSRRPGCWSDWPHGCPIWRDTRAPTTSARRSRPSPAGTAAPTTRLRCWPEPPRDSHCYPICVRHWPR